MAQPKPKKSIRATKKYIIFNSSSFLCQWQYSPFIVNNIKYGSAEQYMMAEKARLMKDENSLQEILKVNIKPDNDYKAAAKCQYLGRQVKPWNQQKWDANKQNIVYRANLYKFQQNPDLAKKLLSFDPSKTFVSYGNSPWGIGLDIWDKRAVDKNAWSGHNLLGTIITKIRDQLLADQKAPHKYPTFESDEDSKENGENDEEGLNMLLLDLMKQELNESKSEFQTYFCRNFRFDGVYSQNTYYKRLCENGVNTMELLMCCDDSCKSWLMETIGLSVVHYNLFVQRVEILKLHYNLFVQWLDKIKMNEYLNVFRNKGIFTFEMFYNKIDGFQDVMNIIGSKNQIDAHLLWNATPKAQRYQKMQKEGH